MNDLDAIAISAGPGSYTGLRVGMATAKGICYALQKPLLLIGTLKMMAAGAVSGKDELMPNDRRPAHGGVYRCIYSKSG